MKSWKRAVPALLLALATACLLLAAGRRAEARLGTSGQLFLYGGYYDGPEAFQAELETWSRLYHRSGVRHLFVEHTFGTAEYLNQWMKAEDDDILDRLYQDWLSQGAFAMTGLDQPYNREGRRPEGLLDSYVEMLRQLKAQCPETVFHGVGLTRFREKNSPDRRYLNELHQDVMMDEKLNKKLYQRVKTSISECEALMGRQHRQRRETCMARFLGQDFDRLGGLSAAGFFGWDHVEPEGTAIQDGGWVEQPDGSYRVEEFPVDNLGTRLLEKYGSGVVQISRLNR